MDDDAIFWERLAEMPFEEHEQECVLRRERINLQIAVLRNAKQQAEDAGRKDEARRIGLAICDTCAQLTLINERMKYVRRLIDKIKWRNAVKAVLGDEAHDQVVEWMAQQESAMLPLHATE